MYNILVHAGSVIKRLLLTDSQEIFLVEILEHLILTALPDPLTHPLPHMYSGMKLLITPLLSGLLENDFNKMTEFDDFFKEIEKINRKKVTHCLVYVAYACLVHYASRHDSTFVLVLQQMLLLLVYAFTLL